MVEHNDMHPEKPKERQPPSEDSYHAGPKTKAETPLWIDVDVALMRLGGRRYLLHRMLTNFIEEFGEITEKIRLNMQKGDTETIGRLAHKIKGAASQIGAHELSQAAKKIEKNILDIPDNFDLMLVQFDDALTSTLKEVSFLLESDSINANIKSGDLQHQDITEHHAKELKGYLKAGDMRALSLWRRLKTGFEEMYENRRVSELDQMINQLDFVSAFNRLTSLLHKIQRGESANARPEWKQSKNSHRR